VSCFSSQTLKSSRPHALLQFFALSTSRALFNHGIRPRRRPPTSSIG
jgi:hypothetical protein